MEHSTVVQHRTHLADRLDELTPEQWDAPSLCQGWAIRHVVAHITMPFRYSTPRFLFELARSGGRFNAMSDRVAQRDGARPTDELIAGLRDHVDDPWTPPGGGTIGALTHDVVHGLDITAALGLDPVVTSAEAPEVLDNLMTPKSLDHFGVALDGIGLDATDVEWCVGKGESVSRPSADLILLIAGRRLPDGTSLAATDTDATNASRP